MFVVVSSSLCDITELLIPNSSLSVPDQWNVQKSLVIVFSSVVSRTAITAGESASQGATALAPGPGRDPDPGPGTGTTNMASLAPNMEEKAVTTETTRTAAPPQRSPGSTKEVATTEPVA